MRTSSTLMFFSLLVLGCVTSSALAENMTRVEGYTIHHNALTSDLLEAKVASAYQIRRSKNRAILNVSVLKDMPDDPRGQPVTARVTAVARNLLGQERKVPMREIRAGTAVYYIGDFLVADRETLHFELSVQPDDSDQSFQASLSKEFFTK